MTKLDGKKVAILVANFFEQVEMTKPRAALEEAGAEVKIVSLNDGQIQGMNHEKLGDKFDVRAFHDQVLANGALPMDLLEKRLKAWVARQKTASASR